MNDEIKKLLEDNLKLTKESLIILKRLQRDNRISLFFKFISLFIIIILVYYSYNLLIPYFNYLKQLIEFFKDLQKPELPKI